MMGIMLTLFDMASVQLTIRKRPYVPLARRTRSQRALTLLTTDGAISPGTVKLISPPPIKFAAASFSGPKRRAQATPFQYSQIRRGGASALSALPMVPAPGSSQICLIGGIAVCAWIAAFL